MSRSIGLSLLEYVFSFNIACDKDGSSGPHLLTKDRCPSMNLALDENFRFDLHIKNDESENDIY